MKITIKQIQGVLLSNVLILGLAACTTAPSPWSNQDSGDSPWKAKRAAEASSAPAEEFVEVQLEEVAAPEPEPMYEPEPVVMPEPMPVPMPEPMPEPVYEPEPVAGDIMAYPASGYAVQVYAGRTEESVTRYQAAHGLEDLWSVKTDRDGMPMYVLISVHDDRASANQSAADLEQKTGAKPWVRTVSGLQKIAIQ